MDKVTSVLILLGLLFSVVPSAAISIKLPNIACAVIGTASSYGAYKVAGLTYISGNATYRYYKAYYEAMERARGDKQAEKKVEEQYQDRLAYPILTAILGSVTIGLGVLGGYFLRDALQSYNF